MPSTFTTLEIGKSALIAARHAMDVTGHNIANAATPGYSRQRVNSEPIIQRLPLGVGVSGMGVKVADIARIRDKFVDAVLRNEQEKKAALAIQKEVFEHMQIVFAEPSDSSIRDSVDFFWAAWHDLSSEPDSASARAQLLEAGRSLCDMLRHLASQLDSLTVDLENGIDAAVAKVNMLAQRVTSLNVEISRALARKEPVGDLLDRRDLLLDELAELTGATVSYLEDGTVQVNLGGVRLVDGYKCYGLGYAFTAEGVKFHVITGPNETDKIHLDSVGGSLGGHKIARDDVVTRFRVQLSESVRKVVDGINFIHMSNVDPDSGIQGIPFFQFHDDILATIKVNDLIVQDPGNIRTQVGDDPLDGSIALAIADFIEGTHNEHLEYLASLDPSFQVSDGDFTEKWVVIVGSLGIDAQKVDSAFDTQELLVKELSNRRDSISGVSIDEEITNLIREQHAFSAASRVITVADEMLDTIINRMGIAGR
ncbi:MAG: flagellar hook-associated protein FlgK [Firmicutes bacterium]|nr:flagellar hook-associated protein FlgK [Candidatus Fermentithermobacillaceae bacterium]